MPLIFLLILVVLSACGQHVAGLNLWPYRDPKATPYNFYLCHSYSCQIRTEAGFSKHQWHSIQRLFRKTKNSEQERHKIAKAIALMETYSGHKTNTATDKAKAPMTRKSINELDCVDETINTDRYLKFLEQNNLLRYHKTTNPIYKGIFFDGTYPHNSAAILEIENRQIYSVDSNVRDNGQEPDIRPLEDWLKRKFENE